MQNENALSVRNIRDKHLRGIKHRVKHVVARETTTTVNSIHVMGSLANNTGEHGSSDIDLRIVTTGFISESRRNAVETLIKEQHADITPPQCTHLDVHISPFTPGAETPHVEI
jgi:predicted nucleotidyltransferase